MSLQRTHLFFFFAAKSTVTPEHRQKLVDITEYSSNHVQVTEGLFS